MDKRDSEFQKKKRLGYEDALQRVRRYCAYQERSHQEVRSKLFDLGLGVDAVDEALSKLINEGFLNEERFAKAFAGGKFRIKHWGRLKIQRELESHGLTERCIATGLKEIDTSDYDKTLDILLRKKIEQTDESNPFVRRDKVARFAISRGFEPDLVWTKVKKILPG
jgi:regulatory protein